MSSASPSKQLRLKKSKTPQLSPTLKLLVYLVPIVLLVLTLVAVGLKSSGQQQNHPANTCHVDTEWNRNEVAKNLE